MEPLTPAQLRAQQRDELSVRHAIEWLERVGMPNPLGSRDDEAIQVALARLRDWLDENERRWIV